MARHWFALVAVAVAFCVQVFIAVDRQSHSVSDTLYAIFPYVVPTLMLLNWVASKASPGRGAAGQPHRAP